LEREEIVLYRGVSREMYRMGEKYTTGNSKEEGKGEG